MPARMPTMATTIISSMSVKPLARSTRDAKASAPSGHLLNCCCLNKCVHLTHYLQNAFLLHIANYM